jgi:hypothetical protein
MQMKFLTTVLFTLLFCHINAQGFDKTLTDSMQITSIAATSDGGCVLLGNRLALQKTVVLKVDASGKTQWVTVLDGYPAFQEPFQTGRIRILQDSEDNYWFNVSSYTNPQTHLTKLDKNGKLLFNKIYSRINSEIHFSGNQLYLFATGNGTPVLWKFKPNGDTFDTKTYPTLQLRSPYHVSTLQKNSLLVYSPGDSSGRGISTRIGFDGVITRTPMPANIFSIPFPIGQMTKTLDGSYLIPDSSNIIKIDSLGRFLWRKNLNVANRPFFSSAPYFRFTMSATTANGGFMAIKQNVGNNTFDIRNFSSDGVQNNSSTISYQNNFDNLFIIKTSRGGYFIAGNTMGTKVRLMKLDENG